MKLALVALAALLVGCGGPRPSSGHARSAIAANRRDQASRRVFEAPHGGTITSLALTPDGDAAVSGDELGGVRLWPTLDGTREPRALELAAPRALAIVRAPDGFAIAMLDAVGGLIILRVDGDGRSARRTVHAAEPAFTGIATAAGGFVAWRADHAVVRLALGGAIIETLAAAPGERILDVAVRGERGVVAIQPSTGTARARMLFVAPALAWGTVLPDAVVPSSGLAMSPNGVRIAAARGGATSGRLVVFDAIQGTTSLERAIGGPITFDFVSETELAVAARGEVTWIDVTRSTRAEQVLAHSTFPQHTRGVLAVGGGRAVMVADQQLALVTPDGTHRYLGYGLVAPSLARFGAPGELVLAVGERLIAVDAALRVRYALNLGLSTDITHLRWLGDGDWLVEYMSRYTALIAISTQGKPLAVLRALPSPQELRYEPTTALATLGHGALAEVLRLERAPPELVRVASLPHDQYASAYPVAPELAGGTRIVVIEDAEHVRIRWLRDPAQQTRGPQVIVDAYVKAVGRAGHVFVWDGASTGKGILRVYRDGKQLAAPVVDAPASVWPDPSGKLALLVAAHGVRAIGVDGTPRWNLALDGVQDVTWGSDGELALVAASGIVRVDPSTGAVLAARCGWLFGLSPTPHATTMSGEPVCTQLR